MKKTWTIFASLLLFSVPLLTAQKIVGTPEVGVEERLGEDVPGSLQFLDEQGNPVRLDTLITKPTILSLVYYSCPGICTPLLSGIVDVLEKLDMQPGKDYEVVTISFDERDTPKLSRQKKNNYLKAFRKPFPPDAWHWLTGDSASIRAITQAVGFHYKRQGNDFVHPGLIIILSPDRKIVRYLYGITFLPFDVKMALTEASEGRVGPTISKVLLYCFSYDPEGKKYAFNFLKVTGTLVILLALLFAAYLVIGNRLRSKKAR
ncbi:MAG TPA: SCO family protein [Bacteroidetes bacterium]|nr:SCO family protein [Bacteroidota bacterium]